MSLWESTRRFAAEGFTDESLRYCAGSGIAHRAKGQCSQSLFTVQGLTPRTTQRDSTDHLRGRAALPGSVFCGRHNTLPQSEGIGGK